MKFAVLFACALLLLHALAVAAEPVRVERGDLDVTIEVKGRLEPVGGRLVIPMPDAWRGRYVVTHAVRPGTFVAAGQVVLRFDDRALRDAVESAKADLEFARAEAEIAEVRRRHAAETTAEGLERARYDLAMARMRLEGYRDAALPSARKQADLDDRASEFGLENAREELSQLERMYSEDELVDETEQIVLRRARWDVANREARLELHRERREYSEKYEQGPQLEALDRDVRAKEAAFARAEAEAGLADRARHIAAERERLALAEKERNLTRLASDLEGMIVRAPESGMLLHGAAEGSLGRLFSVGQQVNPSEPVVTIAQASDLVAAFHVPSERRLELEVGQMAIARPAPEGADALTGRVDTIEAFPVNGKHRVEARLDPPPAFELAGAELEGAVVLKRLRNVLLVPLDRVSKEDGEAFCRIVEEGAVRKVRVVLGPSDDTHVQVEEGLSEGDVLAEPEDSR